MIRLPFLRYIAAVTNVSGQAEIERAKNVLLQSNDILESFGNARYEKKDCAESAISSFFVNDVMILQAF